MKEFYGKKMAEQSLGEKKADIVIKNGRIVNVFTNEIEQSDIAISDGYIVGIGKYEGLKEIDATDRIICPGFIDSHLHLESTLVKPYELIYEAAKKGTTTFIVDPHEVANVAGIDGINFILQQTDNVPANVFVMMPSCVPAMAIEDNGATVSSEDMKAFLKNERILGLGEVMDCNSVLDCDEEMLRKLDLFRNKIIDGHAGYLNQKQIMCYRLAGISTDHECCTYEMAMNEARAGIQILIREGSAAKNLDSIVTGIVKNNTPTDRFAFCTDDKHIAEIERDGHISYNIRRSVQLGINPLEAIKMATINAAKTYGLKNIGAVAPGYQADLVFLSDLESFKIEKVLHRGKDISSWSMKNPAPIKEKLLKTVNIGNLTEKDFEFKTEKELIPIINIVEGQILTKKTVENIKNIQYLQEHCKTLSVSENTMAKNVKDIQHIEKQNETNEKVKENKENQIADSEYNKVAVIERHKATGKKSIGIVKGYSVKNGAIASTFSHDSHNLIVIGDNDRDMYIAVKELERCGGGFAIVENGKVVATLELSIMGLISNEPNETVTKKLSDMIEKAHKMGVKSGVDPFITLSFLALPVIPEIRITTRGIYDVLESRFI